MKVDIKKYIENVSSNYHDHLVTAGITLLGAAIINISVAAINLYTAYVYAKIVRDSIEQVVAPVNRIADNVEGAVNGVSQAADIASSMSKNFTVPSGAKVFSADEAKKLFNVSPVKKK